MKTIETHWKLRCPRLPEHVVLFDIDVTKPKFLLVSVCLLYTRLYNQPRINNLHAKETLSSGQCEKFNSSGWLLFSMKSKVQLKDRVWGCITCTIFSKQASLKKKKKKSANGDIYAKSIRLILARFAKLCPVSDTKSAFSCIQNI